MSCMDCVPVISCREQIWRKDMPLLGAVDLGGTHTRYGLFTQDAQGGLRLERAVTGMTALVKDAQSLRAQWEASLGMPVDALASLVIGIAGPVSDPWHAVTSNADVRLDLTEWDDGQEGRLCPCRLANDFVCEAYACLTEVGRQARPVFGPDPVPDGVRAVLGAGTGLGAAQLVPVGADGTAHVRRAFPAEFGHAPFPFIGRDEADFSAYAAKRFASEWVTGDDVVSGRGLACLHAYLSGEELDPQAASRYLEQECETLRWYARFLGRICAQWALSTLCYGGLYLTGGMVKRHPALPSHPAFIEAFFCAPRLRVLERIPLRRYTHDMSGLWGAAWLAAAMLSPADRGREA